MKATNFGSTTLLQSVRRPRAWRAELARTAAAYPSTKERTSRGGKSTPDSTTAEALLEGSISPHFATGSTARPRFNCPFPSYVPLRRAACSSHHSRPSLYSSSTVVQDTPAQCPIAAELSTSKMRLSSPAQATRPFLQASLTASEGAALRSDSTSDG